MLKNELEYWSIDENLFHEKPKDKFEAIQQLFKQPIVQILESNQQQRDDFFHKKLNELSKNNLDFKDAYFKNKLGLIKSNFNIIGETHVFTLRHGQNNDLYTHVGRIMGIDSDRDQNYFQEGELVLDSDRRYKLNGYGRGLTQE